MLRFEDGKARREGGVDAMSNALMDFWTGVMEARAIAIVSGKANVLTSR